jgi:RNA polymerase subunit RPABC4/transcription elongation factor Spt4
VTGSVFGSVHDFFHSTAWDVIRVAGGAIVVAFWLGTVYWVRKDARRRIAGWFGVWFATLIALVVPFLGPLAYMLFRPPEYLEDVRERELEIRAIERRLGGEQLRCSVCGAGVETDFLVCPVCTARLRQACSSCSKPLEPAWQVCPYCEEPVTAGPPVPLHTEPTGEVPARLTRQQRRRSSTTL